MGLFYPENNEQQTKQFAITMSVYDSAGKPTGKTKSFESNNAFALWSWFQRNKKQVKRKKKAVKDATSEKTAKKKNKRQTSKR